jgi:all-trans-retinol 13,14-reductase
MKEYDTLILGAGWGGLAAASLLAKAGQRVAVLEARDRAGGCGHSFTLDGFSFCAEMQYLMGCGPGGVVQRWLRALGLQDVVEFNAFDPDGYDRIELPGFSFRIPNDASRMESALIRAFPEEQKGISELFVVLRGIEAEGEGASFDAARFLRHPFQFKDIALYGPWPAERVFDHFDLSPRLRAVLGSQCGDIGLAPRDEPLYCLQSALFGYCQSAHFPKKGMGHFVDAVVASIVKNGGEIIYDSAVTRIETDGDRVTRVETLKGEFVGRAVVSNIDPARTSALIEGATSPGYEQSGSCFTIFLGLDIDLVQHGFGRSNVWHSPEVDIDAAIARTTRTHCYEDPFFFLSTPSLYADPGVLAPAGRTTVQINVLSDFDYFNAAVQQGTHATERSRVTREVLAAVERRLIPDLARHCVVQESWTPVDLADRVGLVRGGMYGARLDVENRVVRRVSRETAYRNLFLTGATAGGPGLHGVVASSTRLVEGMLSEGSSFASPR